MYDYFCSSAEIFGVHVAVGNRSDLLKMCVALIGRGGAICTVNPEILYNSLSDSELKKALLDSLCIPDGVGVEMQLRRMGFECERLPGVELGEEILDIKPLKLGIIGGREGVAERAMQALVMRHGNVIPEFTISGYNMDHKRISALICEKRADVVFVCLGSPYQEIFINEMKRFCKETLFISLGGSIDVYSGDKKRAPKIFRIAKCEWIYRIMKEPKRIKRMPSVIGFMLKTRKKSKGNVKIGKKSSKIQTKFK